jgi:uncharacterized protein
MGLKDRLTRLTGDDTAHPSTVSKQDRMSELRRRLDRAMEPRHQAFPARPVAEAGKAISLEHAVAGEEVRTSWGSFFISRTDLKPDALHGRTRIGDMERASMRTIGFLTGLDAAQNLPLSDGLFLDTETTGLMGGTGTFPFLIGLGWFEGDSFVTCQLFARDFSEEGAMLRHLDELASKKGFLVTFNGKAYDLNLLATRFILNRSRTMLTALPHVDLLHPCRRLFAHRLDNARLSTIERHVLGVERSGDVPGFEIPQRYFDWLRRRDGRLLEDVFAHNRMDIVSMASLLKHLTDLIEVSELGCHDHGDLLRLACLVHERGDLEKAGRMLRTLISSHHADVAVSARQTLSLTYKKAHRWEEAAQLWQHLVASDRHNYFAVIELAKFYEHRTGECEKALHLVRECIEGNGHLDDDQRRSSEYRLKRLLRKVSSQ